MLIFWWRKNAKPACDAPRNAVYEWKSWNGWYVKALLPAALHLEARLEHDAADVLRLLPATVRRFLSHLDLTDMSRFLAGRCALMEALEARSIRVVNAKPTDLSRRAVQALCRRLDLPGAEASPDGESKEFLIVKSGFNYRGRSERLLSRGQRKLLCARKASRAIRHGFDYKVSPRPVKKPAHRSGWEFGAHDIIPHDQGDQFVIDANSTPGMGYAVEDGLAFLREPWERDPQ